MRTGSVMWAGQMRRQWRATLQMTQGSAWHRVLLLGGARALASISICHASWDHCQKSGGSGWREVLSPALSSQACLWNTPTESCVEPDNRPVSGVHVWGRLLKAEFLTGSFK